MKSVALVISVPILSLLAFSCTSPAPTAQDEPLGEAAQAEGQVCTSNANCGTMETCIAADCGFKVCCTVGEGACCSGLIAICHNFQTDTANCGSCGHNCGSTNTCSSGVCHDAPGCDGGGSCAAGTTCKTTAGDCTLHICCSASLSACCSTDDVGGEYVACVNKNSDQHNCGTCGNDCYPFACNNGACVGGGM